MKIKKCKICEREFRRPQDLKIHLSAAIWIDKKHMDWAKRFGLI